MSNEWDSAFGGTQGRSDAPAAGPPSPSAPQVVNIFSGAFGSGDRTSESGVSHLPRGAGLLSDEAAEALKLKATETGKRLADCLGKGAVRTASVAQQLSGQGASIGRSVLNRLKRERVSRRCWLTCVAVMGLAAIATAGIECYAHRGSSTVVGSTGTAVAIQGPMSRGAAPPAPSVASRPPAGQLALESGSQSTSIASVPSAVAAHPDRETSSITLSPTVAGHAPKRAKPKSHAKQNRPAPKDPWAEDANDKLGGWFKARATRPDGLRR